MDKKKEQQQTSFYRSQNALYAATAPRFLRSQRRRLGAV